MNETLTNITIKLPAKDWQRMAELYGKNRAWEVRKAIQALIKIAEEKSSGAKVIFEPEPQAEHGQQ